MSNSEILVVVAIASIPLLAFIYFRFFSKKRRGKKSVIKSLMIYSIITVMSLAIEFGITKFLFERIG